VARSGDDWRDEGDGAPVWCIALSPNSKTLQAEAARDSEIVEHRNGESNFGKMGRT